MENRLLSPRSLLLLSIGSALLVSPRAALSAEESEAPATEEATAGTEEATIGAEKEVPAHTDDASSLETSETPNYDESSMARLQAREAEKREAWLRNNEADQLPEKADVLALTVAGGVSLGSYEAGQLYLLTQALRSSKDAAKLKVSTGASAGSANALIAALDACRKERVSPEQSLGYRVWVNVGLETLFNPEKVTSDALFVRDPVEKGFQLIVDDWSKGINPDCDFVFGLSATRQEGYQVELSEGLTVPRVTERFSVHIQGREGMAPKFSNYLDPTRNYERPLLPLSEGVDKTGEQDSRALRAAVMASASFPVAFEPVPIQYCVSPSRAELRELSEPPLPVCDRATRVDNFVDGGVFDNNPLGTAYDLASSGVIEMGDGQIGFREIPNEEYSPGVAPEIVYGYIDPDLRTYERYEETSTDHRKKASPLLGVVSKIAGQALSSARGQALADLAEREPGALSRIWLLEGNYPPISEMVGAFFGFFERDFRDFDFHLGTYDAYVSMRDRTAGLLGVTEYLNEFEEMLTSSPEEIPEEYRKLGCLMGHFETDRYAHLRQLCGGEELRNFRVLLQLTLDRLWSNCRLLSSDEANARDHLQCKRAHGGMAAPQVDPSFSVRKRRYRAQNEDEFDYALRLLDDYEFAFVDLGLDRDHAKKGKITVRRKLEELINGLSDAQPNFANRTLVMTAGRLYINSLAYEPPKNRGYVLLGSSIAGGYLGRIGGLSWLYFNADARVNHLRSLITDRPDEFSGTLGVGLEFAILPISGNIFQFSLGARAGYQLTGNDSAGFETCTVFQTLGDPRACSQMVLATPVNITLMERIRLSMSPLFYPIPEDFGHRVADFEIGLGAEFF